ncbi:MAG: sulfoxide reductase heme-binding subunit YedZ [Candidatus Promineofilum sp.]|jgi:sulfoxide reductase heme-binding subunit YedZ|nr:sulfoxide reductase heme-binding subunit YedZ [Promineifilum sp.]
MTQQIEARTTKGRPRLSREGRRRLLRAAYHAVGLFPLAWLIFDFWFGLLGAEPIRAMILRTGKAAIILLTLSLAATPAGYIFRWKEATLLRRPLGLYAFMYVCLHFLIFIWLDYALIVPLIVEEIVARRYALVGFAAFLLLIPLAVTSTKGWQKRLGKRWKTLHKAVYLIGVLAVVHYIWLVKNAYTQPLLFAAAVGLLLLLRVPAVKQALLRARNRR